MATLVIGCGDIGLRIAHLLSGTGECYGVVRSAERHAGLVGQGVIPLQADLDAESSLALPPALDHAATVVFYLAPPPSSGTVDPRIGRAIAAFPRPPKKWIYISTSGVYGDHQGAWVTETMPANPLTDRARRRRSAERQLLDWHRRDNAPVVILRVPGIYGPARLPLAKLSAGNPIIRPEESPYTNLIHADDLASVCLAASIRGRDGEIYNVGGCPPCKVSDYYLKVAELAGLPLPPFISLSEARQQFDPVRWSFVAESRRLNVDKMTAELCPELRHRELGEGIRASLKSEPDEFWVRRGK